MVGAFREPSDGRSCEPIHSILYIVAQPLERGSNNYYSIIQGSCFTVVIPFEIDTNAKPDGKEDFNEDISGIRVLLAEDNELNAEIAEFMLTESGAEVETVNNGLEAVQHFEASEPGTYDVILMDVMMPVMDGLTATRTIRALERQDAKTIPIIAITANAFKEDAEKCIEAGMNAHIAKPLNDEKIKQTISEELRRNGDS